jgi:hypothetical protein
MSLFLISCLAYFSILKVESVSSPKRQDVCKIHGITTQTTVTLHSPTWAPQIYYNTVICIARQRTSKHLATEYTHATTELRMLLLVARHQLTPIKSLTRNYVTGFLWVRAVTIAMQRIDKRAFNNGATVFRGVRAEGLSWRPSTLQSCSR